MKFLPILAIAALVALLVPSQAHAQSSYTQTDCIAAAIHHEARGESQRGQIAVAEVILARANSKRFASTPCGVVLQPRQFSFVRNGQIPAVPEKSMKRLRRMVEQVRSGKLTAGMKNALYFHATHINPRWRRPLAGVIGRHIFYL